jgi:FAD/FMN-containing dehydrogenase
MNTADDLLWNVREASCCLVCAGGSTCTDPKFCREDAARYVDAAAKIAAETDVSVYASAFGAGTVQRITPDARLEIALDEGGVVAAHACEVVAR